MEIIGVQFAQVLVCAISVALVLLIVVRAKAAAQSSSQLSSADRLVRLYCTDNLVPMPDVVIPCAVGVGRGLSSRAPPESVPCKVGDHRVALGQRR